MPLETILRTQGFILTPAEEAKIRRHLRRLERRLVKRPAPTAALVLKGHTQRREIEADLRVQVGPLARHLLSHQLAETPDRAVRLVVEDVERQLERVAAAQRGEPAFGVPSRRLPARARPSALPQEADRGASEAEESG